jgi:hypothetical protein
MPRNLGLLRRHLAMNRLSNVDIYEDFCHATETANREVAKRIAEHVILLVSSRGRRAFLSDSNRRNTAAVVSLEAMARTDAGLSHATFRARRQSLFDKFQR